MCSRPQCRFCLNYPASLQEPTDRANDWTLDPEHARYGTMTVERFQQELEGLLKLVGEVSGPDTRLIILSPIPHEDLRASSPPRPLPHRVAQHPSPPPIFSLASTQAPP